MAELDLTQSNDRFRFTEQERLALTEIGIEMHINCAIKYHLDEVLSGFQHDMGTPTTIFNNPADMLATERYFPEVVLPIFDDKKPQGHERIGFYRRAVTDSLSRFTRIVPGLLRSRKNSIRNAVRRNLTPEDCTQIAEDVEAINDAAFAVVGDDDLRTNQRFNEIMSNTDAEVVIKDQIRSMLDDGATDQVLDLVDVHGVSTDFKAHFRKADNDRVVVAIVPAKQLLRNESPLNTVTSNVIAYELATSEITEDDYEQEFWQTLDDMVAHKVGSQTTFDPGDKEYPRAFAEWKQKLIDKFNAEKEQGRIYSVRDALTAANNLDELMSSITINKQAVRAGREGQAQTKIDYVRHHLSTLRNSIGKYILLAETFNADPSNRYVGMQALTDLAYSYDVRGTTVEVSHELSFAELPEDVVNIAINEVLENAVQAMVEDPNEKDSNLNVRVQLEGGCIAIIVEDNGVRFSPLSASGEADTYDQNIEDDLVSQAFHATFDRRGAGQSLRAGLGLNIARNVVEKHNGAIAITSNGKVKEAKILLPII